MDYSKNSAEFIGAGDLHRQPWIKNESSDPIDDLTFPGHPARYIAGEGLIAAVNTALLLEKPLLLTGNPGTGKSELAERVAWEFGLGPVLRFEAQSLSEASDLFYRFDLVGRMAAAQLASLREPRQEKIDGDFSVDLDKAHPLHFIESGPLGKAIFRANVTGPTQASSDARNYYRKLRSNTLSRHDKTPLQPRRSVVLIDEIDKASRDFPNDLLDSIERMEFKIRELDDLLIRAPERGLDLHPIVIITSNLERDLPPPFLRRCVFHHILDPTREEMQKIVQARVFPDRGQPGEAELPRFYRELLDFFYDYVEENPDQHSYRPGTSELLDVSQALRRRKVDETAQLRRDARELRDVAGTIAKQRDDLDRLIKFLGPPKPAG